MNTNNNSTIPEELQNALNEQPLAKQVFEKMPPSHQNEYINYYTEAKKPETRTKRVSKIIEMLLKPTKA